MIYGYESRTVNEYGLKQLREVSFAASPQTLRELSAFFLEVAQEMEDQGALGQQWHRHISRKLEKRIGAQVVVLPGTIRHDTPD